MRTVTGLKPTAPAEGADQARYRRVLLAIIALSVTAFGSLMTIVTVSLDTIAEDLGSNRTQMTWTVTGLMLTMAVCTPLAGKLGDLKGHKKIFLIGLTGSAMATVLCALAWSAASLIAFRVLFGMFGAMVTPNGMTLMMHAYGPERRSTAIGYYQSAMTLAPTLGVSIGGPMIDVVGWRWVFLGFSGITMVALVLGATFVRSTPRQTNVSLDYGGAATLGLGVLAGLLAITRFAGRASAGESALADPIGWLMVGASLLGLLAFVQVEQRVPAPMLRIDYFRRRNFTLPMLSGALTQFAYMGGFIVIPALMARRYGWAVGAIALLMVPRPFAFGAAAPLGGKLPQRYGEKVPIMMGTFCMVGSMLAFAGASVRTDVIGVVTVAVGLVLSGAAAGLSQPPIGALVVSNVDQSDVGIATGMNQQMTFIGIVSGMQLMSVFIGDSAEVSRFVLTFVVGLMVALLGVAAAWGIRDPRAAPVTDPKVRTASEAKPV